MRLSKKAAGCTLPIARQPSAMSLITNNLAGSGGGGIRYSYGSVNLENVVVAHNSARSGGAGIHFYHADGTIKNALIADNFGGGKGGAWGLTVAARPSST